MDFKKIADKAKQVVDSRGGVDSLKEDAEQITGIVKGQGSVADKAKAAAAALTEPGGEAAATAAPEPPADPVAEEPAAPDAESKERDREGRRDRHRKGGHGGHRRHRGEGGQDADPAV